MTNAWARHARSTLSSCEEEGTGGGARPNPQDFGMRGVGAPDLELRLESK